MKVRWRQQEIIFVTLVGCFLAVKFFLDSIMVTDDEMIHRGAPFMDNGAEFNYLRNYIFPNVIPLVVAYIFFLFLNLYIIPVLILRKKYIVLAVISGITIWFLLLLSFSAAYYAEGLYQVFRNSGLSLRRRSLKYGLSISGVALICYVVYAYLRELAIKFVSDSEGNKAFRIMVTNNITGTFFVYTGLLLFFWIFHIFSSDVVGIFFVFFIPPAIINCLINMYWLFPYKQRKQLSFKKIFWYLQIAPIVLSIVSWMVFLTFSDADSTGLPIALWAMLLLVATPVSWLLFVQQREKLETVLNLQKNLGNTSANLQFLRSQINPHFLFNALNTIYGTALQENADRTAEGVQKLGDMMRFMLQENQEDKIALSKEINYLTNYIALQKLRTQVSNDIDISFTVKDEQCLHEIAPMLLIPFVENAFKHGISLKEKSWIKINISCDTEHVYFDVYNSVHPKKEDDPEKNRSGIGLENVKQRLSLLYPNRHELQIRATSGEYFVHLTIKPSK
ncbi:MAG: histidine kinase [Agriterribacter sp.]